MTTTAETERTEAEDADAEDRDDDQADYENDDQDDDQEPTEPVDPAAGLEEPSELMMGELRAACDDHHDHVRQIMGSFVEGFVTCETCNGIGIAYPTPQGPKYEHAQGLTTCSTCAGLGELETGSQRPNYGLVQCTRCQGKGYVGDQAGTPAAATEAAVATYPVGAVVVEPGQQPLPPESTDPFEAEAAARGYIVLKKPGT